MDGNASQDFPENEIVEACYAFCMENLFQDIIEVLTAPDETKTYGINVNFQTLVNSKQEVGQLLLHHAKCALILFERGLQRAQEEIYAISTEDAASHCRLKRKLRVRIYDFAVNQDPIKGCLPRASDVNRFMCVRGTVVRTGQVKMLEWMRVFKCGVCHLEFEKEADLTSQDPFPYPLKCESGAIPACNSRKFTPVEKFPLECRDFQEIKVQEHMHTLGAGSIPRSIVVILMEDLVDTVKPGDDVALVGEVIQKWKNVYPDERCDVETMMLANHVRINNEIKKDNIYITDERKQEFEEFWKFYADNPLQGRNIILNSICPDMCGLAMVKLSVALVLAGGVAMRENTHRVRGESHLLLVGDPGTGKSQILKSAARIANRSVVTTGIGTTTAGLTVSAVKDKGGDWILEAGALVLADGGLCCIDEFNSIQEKDKTSIHEAMEQQTISVAKAGLICTLQTKCSVIAATNPKNPKGKYDPSEDLSVNLAMATPLLSRFDIVLVMMDEIEKDWDRRVSDFILRGGAQDRSAVEVWPVEKLQSYFNYIKATFAPNLSDRASAVLARYWKVQRSALDREAGRTTIRLLESSIRLTQAHAKLLFRKTAELQDAIIAIIIIESSMVSSTLLGGNNSVVRSCFTDNAEAEYRVREECILKAIGLASYIPRYTDNLQSKPKKLAPIFEQNKNNVNNSGLNAVQPRKEDVMRTLEEQKARLEREDKIREEMKRTKEKAEIRKLQDLQQEVTRLQQEAERHKQAAIEDGVDEPSSQLREIERILQTKKKLYQQQVSLQRLSATNDANNNNNNAKVQQTRFPDEVGGIDEVTDAMLEENSQSQQLSEVQDSITSSSFPNFPKSQFSQQRHYAQTTLQVQKQQPQQKSQTPANNNNNNNSNNNHQHASLNQGTMDARQKSGQSSASLPQKRVVPQRPQQQLVVNTPTEKSPQLAQPVQQQPSRPQQPVPTDTQQLQRRANGNQAFESSDFQSKQSESMRPTNSVNPLQQQKQSIQPDAQPQQPLPKQPSGQLSSSTTTTTAPIPKARTHLPFKSPIPKSQATPVQGDVPQQQQQQDDSQHNAGGSEANSPRNRGGKLLQQKIKEIQQKTQETRMEQEKQQQVQSRQQHIPPQKPPPLNTTEPHRSNNAGFNNNNTATSGINNVDDTAPIGAPSFSQLPPSQYEEGSQSLSLVSQPLTFLESSSQMQHTNASIISNLLAKTQNPTTTTHAAIPPSLPIQQRQQSETTRQEPIPPRQSHLIQSNVNQSGIRTTNQSVPIAPQQPQPPLQQKAPVVSSEIAEIEIDLDAVLMEFDVADASDDDLRAMKPIPLLNLNNTVNSGVAKPLFGGAKKMIGGIGNASGANSMAKQFGAGTNNPLKRARIDSNLSNSTTPQSSAPPKIPKTTVSATPNSSNKSVNGAQQLLANPNDNALKEKDSNMLLDDAEWAFADFNEPSEQVVKKFF